MGAKRFYVYTLIDPRPLAIFYVGKGQGRRMYAHVIAARNGATGRKAERIREVISSGLEVIHTKIAFFNSEREAFAFEKMKIIELKESLTNLVHVVPNPIGVVIEGEKDLRKAHVLLNIWNKCGFKASRFWFCQQWISLSQEIMDNFKAQLDEILSRHTLEWADNAFLTFQPRTRKALGVLAQSART